LLGGVLQLVFYAIGRNGHIEPEAFVRYAIVGTVAFYCVVAVVIIHRVHMRGVRLMWTQGNPRVSAAIGAGVGVALGGGMVALISASQGHLATDANAQLIASEGDIAHLAALVLITMLAAPLVEETLFRGLFAESMRARGVATAVWTSAIAFAFWHWPILNASTPAFIVQTIYYTLMGAMFARLYWRGGLVRSMSAHAGFNGALTVAAIALALSPGHVIHGDGYQFSAPRGWHQPSHQQGSLGGAVLLVGPSDASVFVDLEPTFGLGRNVTADDLVARFSSGQLNGFDGLGDIVGRPTEERLPAGEAVEVDLNVRGHTGALVMLPTSQGVVIVGFGSGGSARADHDFQQMLQSLRIT
jgi:membrane protease YdiL (CAAX protease family)